MRLSKSLEPKQSEASGQVPVRESYTGYRAPPDTVRRIERLQRYVPPKYLGGLGEVLLTNSGGSRAMRRTKTKSRNRTIRQADAMGLYHRPWNGIPACIVVHVDKHEVYRRKWGFFGRFQLTRDYLYGLTLFHELGHHIHTTTSPEYRQREDVADRWQNKLMRSFLRRKYWYLIPVVSCVRLLGRYKAWRTPRRSRSESMQRPPAGPSQRDGVGR